MTIHIHIDRLVLDGIEMSQRERPLLQTAVETELARLLTEDGLTRQANVALRDIPAEPIQLSHENNPARIGRQIARSVYRGINR
jgi:hypothetical protein